MHTEPPRIWIAWLLAASAGVIAFGLALVLAPAFARRAFSLLVYASPDRIDAFGAEAARYVALVHAVLGAVLSGWGLAMWLATRRLIARGRPEGWVLVAAPLACWFVPDTAYSLLSGFWQNAVLNGVVLALFAVPLWGMRPRGRRRSKRP